MKIDKNFYPGFVRKAITFTIDDGNIPLDKKFISIVKPKGIKGTFNLCAPDLKKYTAEEYREIYDGFGISNHCKFHPFAMNEERKNIPISDEEFSESANIGFLYKTQTEGLYHYHTGKAWRKVADDNTYCKLIDECKILLENVFGKGSIVSYVWPFCEQNNDVVKEHIKKSGYKAVRKARALGSITGYALPEDRMKWSYNSSAANIFKDGLEYEAYPDDGELKFFCFGVHSHDFENGNCWDVLEEFAERFGNRPTEFWYASVEDIFKYEDAVKSLEINKETITNHSDLRLYMMIDSEKIVIEPKSTLEIH